MKRHSFFYSALPYVVFALTIFFVQPWGNFPLNDDWQYAVIAKRFAESGVYKVDTSIAPSLVGQVLLSTPLIKLFGFSHTLLRIQTIVMAFLLLGVVDALCRLATKWKQQDDKKLRALVLTLLALNPLFLNLSLSYMTEVPAYLFSFAGAYLVLYKRVHHKQIGMGIWIVTALLGVYSFWIRQFAVTPILSIFALEFFLYGKNYLLKTRVSQNLSWFVGALIFGLGIGAYFLFKESATNPGFASPFAQLFSPKFFWFVIHALLVFGFLGLFFLPYVAFTTPRTNHCRYWLIFAFLLFVVVKVLQFLFGGLSSEGASRWQTHIFLAFLYFGLLAPFLFALRNLSSSTVRLGGYCLAILLFGGSLQDRSPVYCRSSFQSGLLCEFPYFGHIVNAGGIGVPTFSNLFLQSYSLRPQLHPLVLLLLEVAWFTGLAFGAAVMLGHLQSLLLSLKNKVGREWSPLKYFNYFLLICSLFSLALSVSAYRANVFDRYYFPLLLVFPTFLLCSFSFDLQKKLGPKLGLTLFCFGLTPLVFSVWGTYNYFRVNEHRWSLAHSLMAQGVHPRNIDGGYEFNGWYSHDDESVKRYKNQPIRCIGECSCQEPLWYCYDQSYLIALEGNRVVVKKREL